MSTPGEREELELVTDFGSLRAGELVVVIGCIRCGRPHRGILLDLWGAEPTLAPDGSVYTAEASWELVPRPGCCTLRAAVTPDYIPKKALYRVIIPPAASQEEHHRVVPRKERVR